MIISQQVRFSEKLNHILIIFLILAKFSIHFEFSVNEYGHFWRTLTSSILLKKKLFELSENIWIVPQKNSAPSKYQANYFSLSFDTVDLMFPGCEIYLAPGTKIFDKMMAWKNRVASLQTPDCGVYCQKMLNIKDDIVV